MTSESIASSTMLGMSWLLAKAWSMRVRPVKEGW